MKTSFQLRSRFFPYVYTAVQQACAESLPFIRPMYLDYPSIEAAYHQPQQYLFGIMCWLRPSPKPALVPIAWAGKPSGSAGAWYNYFSNEKFDGDQQTLVAADINEFPLYIRGGVPIPMRSFTQRMATDPLSSWWFAPIPALMADRPRRICTRRRPDHRYRAGAFAQTN